jgi:hypothetical protein
MTALQDWLSFRPVDQSVVRDMVCRPFRTVLGTAVAADTVEEIEELKLLTPGVERC